MIVPWEKLPVEHCLVTGASFKIIIFDTRSGPYLVRNIFQKGPTNIKSLSHHHDNPTRGQRSENEGWKIWREKLIH